MLKDLPGASTLPVQIATLHSRAYLRLKCWGSESANHTLGPEGPNRPSAVGMMHTGSYSVACIGPGDWLIYCEEKDGEALRAEITAQIHERKGALVDVSDSLVTIRLEGDYSRELLSCGCGLDLDPRVFQIHRCARTRLAMIAVVIIHAALNRYELILARSSAQYLSHWLADAAYPIRGRIVN